MTQPWPLSQPPADYVLGHVRAVLPDRVLDDARIVVRDGLLAEVAPHPAGSAADVDGAGLLCLPGLIDTHSDALEKERLPRPGAELPLDFALLSLEGKLRAAGITTAFHGAGFQHKTAHGTERTVSTATRICAAVAERSAVPGAPVDHRLLYRLDARSAEGAEALRAELDRPEAAAAVPPLVSHEDHTPGQGQYTDRRYMERFLRGAQGMTEREAETHVDDLIAERGRQLPVLEANHAWLGELARAGRIRLVGHDPDSPEAVKALRERGGSVAEFPTTIGAAKAARDLGFPVVMGAPNVLRGSSHSGNVSATDLITDSLVTALASDYLPSGLLAAAFALARTGVLPLPGAVALITSGPAAVGGLPDRGRLEAGLRADLVLVDDAGPWPAVAATLRALSWPGADLQDPAARGVGRVRGRRAVRRVAGRPAGRLHPLLDPRAGARHGPARFRRRAEAGDRGPRRGQARRRGALGRGAEPRGALPPHLRPGPARLRHRDLHRRRRLRRGRRPARREYRPVTCPR